MNTVSTAIATNENQKNRMVNKLFNLIDNEIEGKTILQYLGLSFKHMTDDVRESASIEMIEQYIEKKRYS